MPELRGKPRLQLTEQPIFTAAPGGTRRGVFLCQACTHPMKEALDNCRASTEITGMDPGSVQLTKDCPAVQIPAGTPVTLPKGTDVYISQSLGGTYTVHAPGGLFRISGENADALGLDSTEAPAASAPPFSTGTLDEQLVWETLKSCYDPEIPVNIVDLGLVYNMKMEETAPGSYRIDVKMTLTAPGCGMGSVIAADAQQKILSLPGVDEASVEIVWDPPWHQSMITAEGRRILGLE